MILMAKTSAIILRWYSGSLRWFANDWRMSIGAIYSDEKLADMAHPREPKPAAREYQMTLVSKSSQAEACGSGSEKKE